MADEAPWLKSLGIGQSCRLVAMCRGCVTLTEAPDGTHAVWLYNHAIATGTARDMRDLFADHMRGDWLEKYFRSM